jgi:RNA polymerase sigma-70 factor, ECF subfamily
VIKLLGTFGRLGRLPGWFDSIHAAITFAATDRLHGQQVMPDADERLLVEAAQRDPSRFADLYERHFERVYAYVVYRVRNRDAAEDLTSEVFHKALANIRKYEWRGAPFGAWLLRIAANAIVDRAKRSAREVVDSDRVPEASAEPDVAVAEEWATVFRLIQDLPADQRTVVVSRYIDERSIKEVAAQLNRSEGAIKQLQLRALQALRTRLEGADA